MWSDQPGSTASIESKRPSVSPSYRVTIVWILGDPLVVQVAGGERIEVPVGFTTDGASIPGWAQTLTGWEPWEDPQRWAGVVHDWLYSQPGVSKSHADDVFRAVLASEGASSWKRKLMYGAVVAGGWWAYRADQARGPRMFP